MKAKFFTILLLAGAALLAASCGEKDPDGPKPASGVKVTLPSDGPLSVYKWCDGDGVRIGSEVFSIKSGVGTATGAFDGVPAKDSYYTIAHPSEITGVDDYLSFDFAGQLQDGNGSVQHLLPTVLIEDVSSAEDITLSEAWAVSKGGTFRTNGVIAFDLKLPAGAGDLESITLQGSGVEFPVNNSGSQKVDKLILSLSNVNASQSVKAFMSVSEKEVEIAAGEDITLTVTGASTYSIALAQGLKMGGGILTQITVTDASSWKARMPITGAGTEASPYVLTEPDHLEQMPELLQENKTTWFELGADIDMSSISGWLPLNFSSPYNLAVHFDGKGHTISNFTCEAGSYPSLFGVLNGTVKDVVFDNATINGTGKAGVLAGYCGTNVGSNSSPSYITAVVTGVTVQNSKVVGDNYAGGLFGQVYSPSTITACHVKNCEVSSTLERVGGLIGQVGVSNFNVGATITDCTAENVTLEAQKNVGGLVGVCYDAISRCTASGHVTNTLSPEKASEVSVGGLIGHLEIGKASDCSASTVVEVTLNNARAVGGFVGTFKSGKIERCYATGAVSSVHRNIGGFVGLIQTTAASATIENCYSTGNVNSTNGYLGGFIGLVDGQPNDANIINCYSTGDVSANFAAGGLVGIQGCTAFHMTHCAAWNGRVTAVSHAQTNWSSGAIIGVTHPNCYATDNYRNPNMVLTVYCPPPSADWDHPDINGTTAPLYQNSQTEPFTWAHSTFTAYSAGTNNVDAGRWAYHGKHVEPGTTLSQLASTMLGWPAAVWDFSGDLPVFKQ